MKNLLPAFLFGGLCLYSCQRALACTTIELKSDEAFLSATNVDFATGLKRAIFLNRRGMWKDASPLGSTGTQAHWFAKYGSVTDTFYAREFAVGGINEAGLVVHILEDTGAYPDPDPSKPKLHIRQSVQYLLDTSSTLDEVAENLNKVDLHKDMRTVHWWACEASGACAVLEFKDKKLTVYRGKDLPIPVITNSAYDESMNVYKDCLAHDCQDHFQVTPNGTFGRFMKASYLTSHFVGSDLLRGAFDILTVARQSLDNFGTLWTVAYRQTFNGRKKEVFFVPEAGAKMQSLNLADLDFSCQGPAQFQAITPASGEGDLKSHFQNYDKSFQLEMTAGMVAAGLASADSAKEMAAYPDTIPACQ